MKKIKLFMGILTLIILLVIVFESIGSKKEIAAEISWVDFIQFNDITYHSNDYLTDEELQKIKLGTVYKEVEKKIADVIFNTDYKTKNGDAAFHEIGTKVYSVIGYDTDFRLAVQTEYGIKLYEADRNPNASFGKDLLDIESKVDYITLNSELDAQTVLITIDNETDVKNIVNIVLNSPIIDGVNIMSDQRYFLEFHLYDGTTITRCYWIDDGLLTRDIKLSNDIRNIIDHYLEK